MVLFFDKPNSHVSILRAKLRHRKAHEARRIGEEAMPLDDDIKGSHSEGEAGVEVLPDAVHDFLEMAHDGQHGEHRLDEHPVLPCAALTQFEVRRVPLGGMEGGITQDDHASVDLPNQPLKGIIGDIGRCTVATYHNAILVYQPTDC